MKKSKEEQIKLHSTYLNNVSVAMLSSGIVVPIVAIIFNSSMNYSSALNQQYQGWDIFSFVCKIIGAVLYIAMSFVVKRAAIKNLQNLDETTSS